MSNRTAKLASAILASVLAGALLATLPPSASRAADDCLFKPKDQTPEGSHWYYRIDHATKRQCWYLREEGERAAPIAAVNAASPARPIAPKAETATPRSLADAHAELPPQTQIQPAYSNAPSIFALPANPPVTEIGPRANPADADPPSVVASRWPDQPDATAAASPAPENSNLAANVVQPAPAPPPAIASIPLIAADAQGRPGSIAILLGVIIGAVALASLIAGIAFKIGRSRRARQRRLRRDAIWQRTVDNRIMPSTDVLPRRARIARDLDRSNDPVERIEEFISQLARQART